MIEVLLVAGSPAARRELEQRLDSPELEIVGSTVDVEMAADELLERGADVLLASVNSESHEDVLESLQETRVGREVSVVLLVHQSPPNFVRRAIRAGVKGILAWDVSANSLKDALQAVVSGLMVFSPDETALLQPVAETSGDVTEAAESLTPREKEVLQRMATGLGNKEIATRLKISEHTVKFHVASILGKLGAGSRTEAVSIGMRRGLILL